MHISSKTYPFFRLKTTNCFSNLPMHKFPLRRTLVRFVFSVQSRAHSLRFPIFPVDDHTRCNKVSNYPRPAIIPTNDDCSASLTGGLLVCMCLTLHIPWIFIQSNWYFMFETIAHIFGYTASNLCKCWARAAAMLSNINNALNGFAGVAHSRNLSYRFETVE